jgi:hypothetical protein
MQCLRIDIILTHLKGWEAALSFFCISASQSTNAIIYDHYLVMISCLVIEVLFPVTKKYLVIEDYSFYDDIQIWS